MLLVVLQIGLGSLYLAITKFCNLAIVACSLGLLGFKLVTFDFFDLVLNGIYIFLFFQPAFTQVVSLNFESVNLVREFFELLFVLFFLDCNSLNLQLHQTSLDLVKLFGRRVYLHS